MKITLLAIGSRLDQWINAGFENYNERLPREFHIYLKEIPASKRLKNSDPHKVIQEEGERLLAAIPDNHFVIALDRIGDAIDTLTLAQKMQRWQIETPDICILIGGPEGLSPACLKKANWTWSLSKLTLPHPLVRIVLAEQIYRAWSIISHHPYHR